MPRFKFSGENLFKLVKLSETMFERSLGNEVIDSFVESRANFSTVERTSLIQCTSIEGESHHPLQVLSYMICVVCLSVSMV